MQTLKDGSSSSVFLVTDVLRGVRYFVADRGSHYEIQVPRGAGYVRVAVSRDTDVIDVTDELIRELDTAESVRLTPQTIDEGSIRDRHVSRAEARGKRCDIERECGVLVHYIASGRIEHKV
jgi:hypothetical protein